MFRAYHRSNRIAVAGLSKQAATRVTNWLATVFRKTHHRRWALSSGNWPWRIQTLRPLNKEVVLELCSVLGRNEKMARRLIGAERSRRRRPARKDHHGAADLEPGMTVSCRSLAMTSTPPTSSSKCSKQFQEGSSRAITAGEDVVPALRVGCCHPKQIRELQRLLGKKTMENEILKQLWRLVEQKMDCACVLCRGRRLRAVSQALGVSRCAAIRSCSSKPGWRDGRQHRQRDDSALLARDHGALAEPLPWLSASLGAKVTTSVRG